jgi:hypothetical protein
MTRLHGLALLCAGVTLAGCVVEPMGARVYAGGGYAPGGYVQGEAYVPMADVEIAPPAPRVEVIGVAPFAGALWIGGYWGWQGGRHAWVGGRWEHPREGYRWEPHRWEAVNGRWHLREGGWRQR